MRAAQTKPALIRRSQRHSGVGPRLKHMTRSDELENVGIRQKSSVWPVSQWAVGTALWGSTGRAITELKLSVCLCDKHVPSIQRRKTPWDGWVVDPLALYVHNLFAWSHALHVNRVKPTCIVCMGVGGPHNSSLHVCFGLLLWMKKFQIAASLAGELDYGCLLCSVIIWGANSKPHSSSSVLAIRFKCSMTQLSNRRVVWLLWFVFRCCDWKQREWWLLKWCKKVKKWVIASRQSHIEIRSCKRSSVMAFKFRF